MADKALFLDRDNTLIVDPGYISHPDQVQLIDGVPEALAGFRTLGYKLVVVTNQSAVARGIVTEKVLHQIHHRLQELLALKGVRLDRVYYCPFHPDGVIEKYRKASDWRKPNPGMILAAARDMGLDLAQSWCIGDGPADVEAGIRAGCKTILIGSQPLIPASEPGQAKPDYQAVNLREALNIVKQHARSVGASKSPEKGPAQSEIVMPQTLPDPETGPTVSPSESAQAPCPEKDLIAQAHSGSEQVLREILEQLKGHRREEMFEEEFSSLRLLAGIAQISVLGCLLIAIWFMMSQTSRYEPLFTALGFAAVFQIMALTFYTMRR